jgi:hypothetical protein
MILLVVLWVVFAFVGAGLLNASGRGGTGFALGFFLGPLGVIIAAIMRLEPAPPAPAAPASVAQAGERKCPTCAEWVKREAIRCRFCGTELAAMPARAANEQCADCYSVYSGDLTACPQCRSTRRRSEMPKAAVEREGRRRNALLLGGGLVLLILIGALVSAAMSATPRSLSGASSARAPDSTFARDLREAGQSRPR